jgi:trimethylamine--corrinoid protein Co-methyltransferase
MTFVQLSGLGAGSPVVRELDVDAVGAPTFGTLNRRSSCVMAALARRLGCRSVRRQPVLPDRRRAGRLRVAATLQPTVPAGVNCAHAAGWLEGGLTVGYEMFILDADQCGMMQVLAGGVDLSENGQALDAILTNEPGTHYLGSAHTLANFESAFYRSETADNNSFEQWAEDGSLDAAQRANAIWKRMLADYEAPPMDQATDEALLEYIIRKKASMPDAFV